MSLIVSINGTVQASQAQASDGQFPSGVLTIAFNLNPATKLYNVHTDNVLTVNSPVSFATIPGIGGAVGPVTQALTLYARAASTMQLRLTHLGDATPKVVYIGGIYVAEFDPSHPLTLLEVQGGGTLEYAAFGNV